MFSLFRKSKPTVKVCLEALESIKTVQQFNLDVLEKGYRPALSHYVIHTKIHSLKELIRKLKYCNGLFNAEKVPPVQITQEEREIHYPDFLNDIIHSDQPDRHHLQSFKDEAIVFLEQYHAIENKAEQSFLDQQKLRVLTPMFINLRTVIRDLSVIRID